MESILLFYIGFVIVSMPLKKFTAVRFFLKKLLYFSWKVNKCINWRGDWSWYVTFSKAGAVTTTLNENPCVTM